MTFRREKSKILEKGFNLKTKSGSFGALGLEMAVGTLGQEPGAGAWGRREPPAWPGLLFGASRVTAVLLCITASIL